MKPGIIRKLFIYHRIERLTKRELILSKRLKGYLNNNLVSIEAKNLAMVAANICVDEISIIQEKKKKLYFKLT